MGGTISSNVVNDLQPAFQEFATCKFVLVITTRARWENYSLSAPACLRENKLTTHVPLS